MNEDICDLFNGSGTVVAVIEKEVISVKIIENGTSKNILLRTAALLKKNVKNISFPLGADGAPVNFSRILCCPLASAEKVHSRKFFHQKMMNLCCISWKELKQVAVILSEHVIRLARCQGARWIDHQRKALTCLTTNIKSVVTVSRINVLPTSGHPGCRLAKDKGIAEDIMLVDSMKIWLTTLQVCGHLSLT